MISIFICLLAVPVCFFAMTCLYIKRYKEYQALEIKYGSLKNSLDNACKMHNAANREASNLRESLATARKLCEAVKERALAYLDTSRAARKELEQVSKTLTALQMDRIDKEQRIDELVRQRDELWSRLTRISNICNEDLPDKEPDED